MDPESTQLQQAQLAALLGPDSAPFETLISHLMSSSNELRSQAESIFNLCKQTDPNSLSLKLAHLLQLSPHLEARAMSAILLRKQLTRDDSYLWPRLSASTQSSIKSILLSSIQREDSKSISKKLCDTVSELASGILPDNGWPELLPFMFQCVSSDSPKLQESAFLIFAHLLQYIGDTLVPHIKHLHAVFLQCLTASQSSDVKIAALNAAINFIQCLSNSADRDGFQDLLPAMMTTFNFIQRLWNSAKPGRLQDLLPAMMTTLTEFINGNEATAQEALQLLIELAGTKPRFFQWQLGKVVDSMLQIAEAESLEEGTRHLAIEFVITLAEARERAPGMMRELPQFISRLFAILMKMLLDIEDDPAWHTAEIEEEDAGETSNYSVAQECLDRLSISLGGNTIVPVASEQLPVYLAAPEWQKHHAALIALAQIAEGCAKVMSFFRTVWEIVLNYFADPHPRVRWAAINAIVALSACLDHGLRNWLLDLVVSYVDAARFDFQNLIVQVAPTMIPLLKFYFHEEVRKAAVSAMPELLRSAKLAVGNGLAQGHNESFVKQLSDYIVPALVEALHKEPDTEICASMLDALNECVQISGPLLDESQVKSIVDEIKEVITASSTRKKERAERTKAEDFDAKEGELIKEENEQEEEVLDKVGEILGTLIKTFKAAFLPFFDELSSYLTPMWGKDKTPQERRITICVFDDVAEQCREAALKYYDTFLPILLEACNDDNSDVRKAAVYGLGVCAEFGGPVFKHLVGEALSRLNVVIRHPNALEPDNIMAYDNAVSALGKICQFHRDSIDSAQVVPAWLNCLPIKRDLIAAKVVHEQLCSMVERSDRELLGPNNQHLPKIVAVFAEVLSMGKDLATEQTASRMINLLRQHRQTLSQDTLVSTWYSLQPQQQRALQSIFLQ